MLGVERQFIEIYVATSHTLVNKYRIVTPVDPPFYHFITCKNVEYKLCVIKNYNTIFPISKEIILDP